MEQKQIELDLNLKENLGVLVKYRFIEISNGGQPHYSSYFIETIDLITSNRVFGAEFANLAKSLPDDLIGTGNDEVTVFVPSLIEFHLNRQGSSILDVNSRDLNVIIMWLVWFYYAAKENGKKNVGMSPPNNSQYL